MPNIVEKFDPHHKCLTPGTIYHTEIHGNTITVSMDLPKRVDIPGDEKFQIKLEANMHYSLEGVLAQLLDFSGKEKPSKPDRMVAGRAEWR